MKRTSLFSLLTILCLVAAFGTARAIPPIVGGYPPIYPPGHTWMCPEWWWDYYTSIPKGGDGSPPGGIRPPNPTTPPPVEGPPPPPAPPTPTPAPEPVPTPSPGSNLCWR